ncbi:Ankyrin-1 [Dactylellina cionopaga]|nr:Ankyrin-1 [Dactylellina cionopaga]
MNRRPQVPDVNEQDRNGRTALHRAVLKRETGDLLAVLKRGPNKDIRDCTDKAALHLAIDQGNEFAVRWLLRGPIQADVNVTDRSLQTPLHYAAREGHVDMIQKLLTHNANPDLVDKLFKQTPLHVAVAKGKVEVVEAILQKANPNIVDRNFQTCLHRAAESGFHEIVIILLEKGAEPGALDKNRKTPLHLAAVKGHDRVVTLLLNKNLGIKDSKDKSGQPPIYYAILNGHQKTMESLKEAKGNMEMMNGDGQTLLYQFAKLLASEGANLELVDDEGRTPLYLAAWCNQEDIVELLCHKYHAKTTLGIGGGESLLHRAIQEVRNEPQAATYAAKLLVKVGANRNAKDTDGKTPLHIAPNNAREAVLTLIRYEASINLKDNMGQTPLHVFAARGDDAFDLIELLIQRKAKVATTDINGQTPLHAAVMKGGTRIVGKLLEDPIVKKVIDLTDNTGKTPLHEAAQRGKHEIVHLLCKNGANRELVDKNGQMPLHLACFSGDQATISVLLDPGPYILVSASFPIVTKMQTVSELIALCLGTIATGRARTS